MVTVSYNNGIPNGPNNPSNDQPDMKVNTDAVDTILAIDHVSFNAANGGTHKQITFSSENTPGSQTDPQSVLYTTAGTASTVADMRFKNQNGIFPVNCLRAFGTFTNGATPTLTNSFNVNSVTSGGATGPYTITLTSNAITGTGNSVITVLITVNAISSLITYSYTTNQLVITNAASGQGTYNFMILQV